MSIDWENMPEEMLQQIEEVRKSLEKTEKGFTRQTVEKCTIAMEKDPLLSGAFCWNILTERPDIVKDLGWYREEPGITDSDMSHLILYLEKNYGLTSEKNVQHALDVVIANHHYHPVCDYLNALEWDGQERVHYALHHFLGADTSNLTYESLKIFMLGAVHGVFHPGCKFEIMLCLVGDQGAGKSSFFRFLAIKDEWFSDDLKKMDNENVYRKMQGHWIIEMAEMLGTASAKSVEEIKAFLSRQKESYKTPYAKYSRDRKRQCVFVGTSNKQRFLPLDRTGNRRFFPVQINMEQAEVHVLDNEAEFRKYMDQLWVEIMVLYKSGDWSLKLPSKLSHKMDLHRIDFMAEDTLTGVIQAWLDSCSEDYVCTRMIYNRAMNMPSDPDRKSISEINDVMNNMIDGWLPGPSSHRFDGVYGTQRAWHRSDRVNEPEPPPPKSEDPFDGFMTIGEQEELPFL